MGNGNFEKANKGKEIISGSSSRKSKKSSKPKKPMRGLGVAALEKLRFEKKNGSSYVPSPQGPLYTNSSEQPHRIQEAYSSPPLSSLSTNHLSGYFQRLWKRAGELGRGNHRFGGSQFGTMTSLIPGNGMLESQQFTEPNMTRNFMDLAVEMGAEELGRGNNRFGGSQFSTMTSLIPGNGILEHQQFTEPNMTRNFMDLLEISLEKQKMGKDISLGGSFSQISGTSDAQELDLELKLSL